MNTCHACGFEEKEKQYEKIEIFWKRGAKKGQVKEVQEKLIEGTGRYFYQLDITAKKQYWKSERWGGDRYIEKILVCPDCGTLKVSEWDLL